MHADGLSLFAIFFILLMLITIPGVIMGWVAAGRIRRSEGKLYGMRFAAFAALFYPILLLFAVLFILCAFVFRFSTFSYNLNNEAALLILAPLITTGLIVWFKFSQALYHGVTKGEPIPIGFRNRLKIRTAAIITILWLGCGTAMYLQRPKPMGNVMNSQSPGGEFIVEASTWHRMRIFGSDELSYRFEIVDQRSSEDRAWEIPVKSLPTWNDGSSPPNYGFAENGTIHWEADNSEVVFRMDGSDVFTIATNPIRIPPGSHVAGTGEIRLVKP
jgi:hypothetical protein